MTFPTSIQYLLEFLGSAIFIMIVNLVMANIKSFGLGKAKLVRGLAYGAAVFAVYIGMSMIISTTTSTSAYFLVNPAFTVGMAVSGLVKWNMAGIMIVMQVLGMIVGQILVVVASFQKYQQIDDSTELLASFVTINDLDNRTYEKRFSAWTSGVIGELIASFIFFFILVFNLGMQQSSIFIVIGFVAAALAISTGSIMNPAYDLAARLVFTFMPQSVLGDAKDDTRWWYAWVPIIIPILAAIAAVALAKIILKTGTATSTTSSLQ